MRFKNKWIIAGLVLTVVPAIVFVGRASALIFTNNVDKSQTVNSTIYSASKDVDINGTVNGDIFCAGQNINIDATVHGDVICAGQVVTVAGKIDGNVRLAGQDVSVAAKVARNATVTAMSFSLDANASVDRDVTAMGQTLNLKGKVGRDVLANGNDVIFNGLIGRDAEANAKNLKLKSNAAIKGNLKYRSPNRLEQQSGARVFGTTNFIKQVRQNRRYFGFNLLFSLYFLLAALLANLVFVLLFPRIFAKTSNVIKQNFGKTVLIGLIANLAVPFLFLAALVSILGIPLGLIMLAVYVLASIFAGSVTGYYIGRMILKDKQPAVLQMLLGSLLLSIALSLPWIGFIVGMVASWVGLGAILITVKPYIGSAHTSKK